MSALNVKRRDAAVRLRTSESERFRSIAEDLNFFDSSDQVAGIFRAADLLEATCVQAKKKHDLCRKADLWVSSRS